jgi:hypothetical protein
MKEPDEKTLHFKKLADMAITTNDYIEKRDYKEILRRSGFSRVKPMVARAEGQEDVFSMMVEKMASHRDQ